MSKRIRELEDALAISHAKLSSTPHPLLTEDLKDIKSGIDNINMKARPRDPTLQPNLSGPSAVPESNWENTKAFGTLTIGDNGQASKYFGRAAGAEVSTFHELGPCSGEAGVKGNPEGDGTRGLLSLLLSTLLNTTEHTDWDEQALLMVTFHQW